MTIRNVPKHRNWAYDDLSPLYQSQVTRTLNLISDARGAFYVAVYARALGPILWYVLRPFRPQQHWTA